MKQNYVGKTTNQGTCTTSFIIRLMIQYVSNTDHFITTCYIYDRKRLDRNTVYVDTSLMYDPQQKTAM